MERLLQNEKDRPQELSSYGELICHLIACGEFAHIPNILQHSRYFNPQDFLITGFIEGLRRFVTYLSQLIFQHDYNYEVFNQALLELHRTV